MITLKVAFEALIAARKCLRWAEPSIVRLDDRIGLRHAFDTGPRSDGTTKPTCARCAVGGVGARSGSFVCGLSQVWMFGEPAFLERNERSSRKKTSRFLPQRKER